MFSAASAAFNTLSNARIAALAETQGERPSSALKRYMESGSRIRSRWLTLRVIGLAIMSVLVYEGVSPELGAWRLLVAALLSTLVYGVPSEIARGIAERRAERAAPLLLRALRPLEMLAIPIAGPLGMLGRFAAGTVHRPSTEQSVTEAEVEIMVNEGEQAGALAHDQSEMIRNVLDFGDLTAADVMVPRTSVTVLFADTPSEEVLHTVAEKGHSRYPLVQDRIDNVMGILHVKDLTTRAASEDLKSINLADIARKPVVFVPEGQTASSVLKDMRAGRHHMAIVIDEFGGMSGVVTLEDLLEEIVGDIQDEHDRDEPPIMDLGDGRLLVDAAVPISDLSRYLGVEIAEGDYHSLGGFLVDRMGKVPAVDASVSESGLEFVVREADERHVVKVEIIRQTPAPESVQPRSRQSAA